MKREEAHRAMAQFGGKIQELGKRRKELEPRIPDTLSSLSTSIQKYRSSSSSYCLSSISCLTDSCEEAKQKYVEEIEECEERLEESGLSEEEKEVLRRGYSALRQYAKDLLKEARWFDKVRTASVFTEAKVDEFTSYISDRQTLLYPEFKGEREKGGVVLYRGNTFNLDFRPNPAQQLFQQIKKSAREGNKQERTEAYERVKERVEQEMQKFASVYGERKTRRSWKPVLWDLEKFKDKGELTGPLKSLLRDMLLSGTYSHDPKPVFDNDGLFSDGSEERLFAFFHSHVDNPKIHRPNGYAGPAEEDLRNT